MRENPQTIFLAQDECSLLSIPTKYQMWSQKGKQPNIVTYTNKRKRQTIIAATNLRNGMQTSVFFNTGDSQTFLVFLNIVLKEYEVGNICMILDNVRFHHAKIVQNFVKENPRLKLIFLPPYSPNLNPQEWIFKWFQKEVTHNHKFTSFDALLKASYRFFTSLQQPNLMSILTSNF